MVHLIKNTRPSTDQVFGGGDSFDTHPCQHNLAKEKLTKRDQTKWTVNFDKFFNPQAFYMNRVSGVGQSLNNVCQLARLGQDHPNVGSDHPILGYCWVKKIGQG